ncbi:MAG: UDP-N-acetylmuramoyl-tripeptide--D-alanyl-D-alanine ligase [Actinobacteria bacterium]|nr:UDP-N-acetylmuramoyl-tripeptide--D-alanyl-D-alanine ligase [Actinomycetota bacterium]MBW3643694.1 UDP-N-acetylmuramoyl-tripeptide--D-alanyl-D-alanine ligase [Actinomycetota bacterium]
MRLGTSEVAAATGGHLVGPDVVVDGASVDSRRVRAGELFVPVVAERDGHDFVPAALAAGAAAYLTSRPPQGGTAVVVDDTVAALAALAGYARSRLPARVVGITGSVGKTTVKDLLASALSQRWRTAASAGSFNNELGVPLTLLGAGDDAEAVVVEMGARFPGDLRYLCGFARPTVGVVTAVNLVHTETFGSLEDVARAKGELVEALPVEGTAVLNADDLLVAAMAGRTSARVLPYGLGHGDVRAEGITLDAELRPSFHLRSPWGDAEVTLAVRGGHQVANALAAAAAALTCGVDPEAVATGLGHASASPWRMALTRSPSGALVLNDAYNANPTSMLAALRALAALDASRRVAVLGTMAELGEVSRREHANVAAAAAGLGIEVLAVDEPAYGVEVVDDVDAALDALGELGEGDAVLVKGSRVAGLERLAADLLRR